MPIVSLILLILAITILLVIKVIINREPLITYLVCPIPLLFLIGWLSISSLQYQKKVTIDIQTVKIINVDDIQIAVLKNRQIINLTERYHKIFCCQELEFKEYPVFVYGILFITDFPYEMKEIPTQKPVKLRHVDPC